MRGGKGATKAGSRCPAAARPARRLAPFALVVAVFAAGAVAAAAGCGSLRAPDKPLDDGCCDPRRVDDDIDGLYTLDVGDVTIAAHQLALMGAGDRVVVAGVVVDDNGFVVGDGTGAVAVVLAAGGAPPVVAAAEGKGVYGAATTTAGGGDFLAVASDAAGGDQLVRYDGVCWPSVPLARPPPASSPPVPMWTPPNAFLVPLPHERALVIRTASQVGNLDPTEPALHLELVDLAADPPAVLWAIAPPAPDGSPAHELVGPRSQLHAFLMPAAIDDGFDHVVLLGQSGQPVAATLDNAMLRLEVIGEPRPDSGATPSRGAGAVLLPLGTTPQPYADGTLLYVTGSSRNNDAATAEDPRRIDAFDPAAGTWRRAGALPADRPHNAAVLLPDGRVAVIGGDEANGHVFYVDPRSDNPQVAWGRASLSRARGIGVAGVLLADGRVLVAGGPQTAMGVEPEPPDFELLSPPYLERSNDRPVIASAPEAIALGTERTIEIAAGARCPDEAVLVAFGNTLLSNGSSQRLVALEVRTTAADCAAGQMRVGVPASASSLPAGRYLLFALFDRVPSAGVAVQVTNDP